MYSVDILLLVRCAFELVCEGCVLCCFGLGVYVALVILFDGSFFGFVVWICGTCLVVDLYTLTFCAFLWADRWVRLFCLYFCICILVGLGAFAFGGFCVDCLFSVISSVELSVYCFTDLVFVLVRTTTAAVVFKCFTVLVCWVNWVYCCVTVRMLSEV